MKIDSLQLLLIFISFSVIFSFLQEGQSNNKINNRYNQI
jgi:hypothetical protein